MPSRRRLLSTYLAAAVCAIAVAVGGCGSSSSSSSSTSSTTSTASSSTASTTPSSSTATSSSQPLTKAAYEAKLGPLLTDVVAPALRAALANGGIRNPQRLNAAIVNVKLAHDQMSALAPPTAVADLHHKAVAVLSSMVSDLTRLRNAETKHDQNGTRFAATALVSDGRHLQAIGGQFTARGF